MSPLNFEHMRLGLNVDGVGETSREPLVSQSTEGAGDTSREGLVSLRGQDDSALTSLLRLKGDLPTWD
jgi:hypothetical protein